MSDQTGQPGGDLRTELRLRPERPRVVRVSRKVLAGLGVVAGLAIGGALILALQPPPADDRPDELYSTDNRTTADGLAGLPDDYAAIPLLGPPLPGDLGRPILRAQEPTEEPMAVEPQPASTAQPSPDEQRRQQEIEAARTSGLFASVATGQAESVTTLAIDGDAPGRPEALPGAPAVQDPQLAFLNGPADTATVSSERVQGPPSPYILQAGSVIPAALVTGIRSDLPGQILAQVTSNVFDSPTGRHLLIPQGSRLVGTYDSQVAFGQSRVLLVWTRLILPDGKSIVLERLPGADPAGYAGLEDEVDYHWGNLARAALVSTLLGIGTELGSDDDESQILRALRSGSQDTINQSGQQIVRRQLDVQPTLTIRPGFPVRVMVTRDLVLAPYQ